MMLVDYKSADMGDAIVMLLMGCVAYDPVAHLTLETTSGRVRAGNKRTYFIYHETFIYDAFWGKRIRRKVLCFKFKAFDDKEAYQKALQDKRLGEVYQRIESEEWQRIAAL